MFIRRKLSFIPLGLLVLLSPAASEAGYIIWPCSGSITSPYGPRDSPCSGCSTFHYGIDIGVGSGTYLGAPANGTHNSWLYDSCGGNIFKISYGGGWETRFLHSSTSLVAVGSAVTKNQDVARSGNTGSCTTGAHLHFEVRKDGVAQSIPGADGSWVTRNTNIPKDYPGLNDPAATIVVVDNTSAGFSVVGSWATGSSAADKYGADYRYHSTAAVSEPASWNASLTAGTYSISAWWPAGTNRSPSAPYILPDGATVTVNQQINGGKWNLLGTKSLSGSATTKLSCWASAGYVVIADAIKYQK
ncbi:MAG: peptidoglycan DD-metalloendopeptidase family protein [Candidatus Sumerlaeaceae bacterium]